MKKYSINFLKENLYLIFKESGILLAYLFGSQARGAIGQLSDVDIAILWPNGINEQLYRELALQRKICDYLKDENIDLGSLNNQSLSFCYNVIKDGFCLFGNEDSRVKYEVYILNEYLDFLPLAEEYNQALVQSLTRSRNV